MTAKISDKAVIQCPQGRVLFREGERGSAMYVIKSGRVQLKKKIHNTSVALDEIGAGAFCGELAMINDQPRPVTATVVEDASLIKIEADDFEGMVRKKPDIALRMLKKMGQRLTEAQYRQSNLSLRTTEGRLLHQLRQEALRVGEEGTLTDKTPLPEDLPDALSLEIGEIKQRLNELVDRELIAIDDDGYFQIVDPEGFDRFLSYLELQDHFEYTE